MKHITHTHTHTHRHLLAPIALPALPALIALLALAPLPAFSAPAAPHLQKTGAATQLIVDGSPYLILGGELHNSSSTSRDYMAPHWKRLADANLNTVLAAVPWDVIEPAEGTYDFTMVDDLLAGARAVNLRLVLLWFGSWKNGLSHYAPAWVKADTARFPRALTTTGTPEILSVFSDANRDADARAFAALMRHVREKDSGQNTVIMVQVENEVGLHGDSRDRSAIATAALANPVPAGLITYLQKNRDTLATPLRNLWRDAGFKTAGSWTDILGASPAAEEAFMAWHYARYIDAVTAAGKKEYDLPMFVNAWIVQPSDEWPGEYPAGGPQAHVLDLWRAAAPHVDLFTPDVYLPAFAKICAEYARPGDGFFVPESFAGEAGAANALTAIGRFRGLGYSPFGIETRLTDPIAKDPLARVYALLRQLAPRILEQQTKPAGEGIMAISLDPQNPDERFTLGGYDMRAALFTGWGSRGTPPERAYGLIIAAGPGEFYAIGANLQITFATKDASTDTIGLAAVEEGVFDASGKWTRGRALNGDEIMLSYDFPVQLSQRQTGTGLRFNSTAPSIMRVKLYRYPQAK
ncbi:MAG: DUF5597 domain-containing protein [Opitutaceae bacterium]|jgi:hypothetical protein|nr:DUF5597 domain-containing protein [Opitutaceae bacterium]